MGDLVTRFTGPQKQRIFGDVKSFLRVLARYISTGLAQFGAP